MITNWPKRAIAFTAYDRPGYLRETLDSWRNVRELDSWFFYASIDPSPRTQEIADLFTQFLSDTGATFGMVAVNKEKEGVLHHPWLAFDRLFSNDFEFVVRVEDDLPVSSDFLEYMAWADKTYVNDKEVAAVIGYTDNTEGAENEVTVNEGFSPWNWGTWKDRWDDYISPTWDHDYSTYNDYPMNQSGWDWNLNTRVLPMLEKKCVYPKLSRVQNIGMVGTHAQPSDFPQSASYRPHFERQEYLQVR